MHETVLATWTRGSEAESEHHGAFCVVHRGRVVRARGNMDQRIHLRSAAKPIQALAVVESGAADRFELTPEELALTVASHNGTPRHAAVAAGILQKIGADPSWLRCGGHAALTRSVAALWIREGIEPDRLHDNCSGKHAGMMAAARSMGADPKAYADPDHPVQRHNLSNMSRFSGVPEERIAVATDGCAVPTFGVPIEAIARVAALFATPAPLPDPVASAARRVHDAVASHPEMIGGEGRLSTDIVRKSGGRLLAKSGAEGVYLVGVRDEDLGIAVKIADGGRRAAHAVVVALLEEHGLVDRGVLDAHVQRDVRTREGAPAGEVRVHL